jgi:hypothetical protein
VNYMKMVEFVGLSGPIKFDASGLRTQFVLSLMELQMPGLVSIIHGVVMGEASGNLSLGRDRWVKWVGIWAWYTVKKGRVFPSPGGMLLTKHPPAGNNLVIPSQGELGK